MTQALRVRTASLGVSGLVVGCTHLDPVTSSGQVHPEGQIASERPTRGIQKGTDLAGEARFVRRCSRGTGATFAIDNAQQGLGALDSPHGKRLVLRSLDLCVWEQRQDAVSGDELDSCLALHPDHDDSGIRQAELHRFIRSRFLLQLSLTQVLLAASVANKEPMDSFGVPGTCPMRRASLGRMPGNLALRRALDRERLRCEPARGLGMTESGDNAGGHGS